MATKTFKVSLSLDDPRIIQTGIKVRSFDKQSIKIAIELTKNSQVYQIPTGAQIKISLLKLARQEQKIILDVPFTSADSIDWVVPEYLDGYQGEVRVGVYLIVGAENIDVGYFNITSSVSDIDSAAEEFTESVLQGWAIEDLTALLPQFQAVLDETTGKDVISAPEIILARGGAQTLGERLDSEKAEVAAQLAHTAKYVRNNKLSMLPKTQGVYVTFIDDDGNTEAYTRLRPVFNEKQVPFVSAMITSKINTPGYMTKEQLLTLQNEGHEICSHTYTHIELDTLARDQVEYELRESKKGLESVGIKCNNIVYPYGRISDRDLDVVSEYYNCATIVSGGINVGTVNSFKLKRVALGSFFDSGSDLASYKAKVDEAVANNGWLIFMMHSKHHDHNETQMQYMSDLIDYIQSLGVSIVTLEEGYKKRGNTLEVGYLDKPNHIIFGANGELYADNIREGYNLQKYANGITINSPITAFPANTVTTTPLTVKDASGFPKGAGILITYRTFVGGTEFQLWFPYLKNQAYKRYWTGSAWSALETMMNAKLTDINAFENTTLVTSFEDYKITYTPITYAGNYSAFPSGQPGLLITNRMTSQPGYDYQEYHRYNNKAVFRRYADENYQWSMWYETTIKLPKLNPGISVTVEGNATVDTNVTLTGAEVGDNVIVNFNLGLQDGLVCSCFVSATNIITLRFTNLTASTITLTNVLIHLTVLK